MGELYIFSQQVFQKSKLFLADWGLVAFTAHLMLEKQNSLRYGYRLRSVLWNGRIDLLSSGSSSWDTILENDGVHTSFSILHLRCVGSFPAHLIYSSCYARFVCTLFGKIIKTNPLFIVIMLQNLHI